MIVGRRPDLALDILHPIRTSIPFLLMESSTHSFKASDSERCVLQKCKRGAIHHKTILKAYGTHINTQQQTRTSCS